MSYLIALDDGHGMETDGKRTPTIPRLNLVIRENEFNRAVKRLLDVHLKRCGFRTLFVAPGDTDVPLKTRTDRANNAKADLYFSIHFNAFDGKWESDAQGVSVHVYPGYPKTKEKAQIVLKWLLKGTPQLSRGVIESDFYVLRETHMDSILIECGFMDSLVEARLMASPGFRAEVAEECARAICEIFAVTYISEQDLYLQKVKELSSANTQLSKLTADVSRYITENAVLRENMLNLEEKVNDLKEENQVLIDTSIELNDKNEEMEIEIEHKDAVIEELTSSNDECRATIEQNRATIEQNRATIERLLNENTDLQKIVDNYECNIPEDVDKLKSTIVSLESQVADLKLGVLKSISVGELLKAVIDRFFK